MPVPSYASEIRLPIANKELSTLAQQADTARNLADVLKILNEMRAKTVELWNIPGSKPHIARALQEYVLPAMAATMKRFGIAMRDESNAVKRGTNALENDRLMVMSIAQENAYWETQIKNVPERNREEPTFHHDMMGVETFLRFAIASAEAGEAELALKQLRDTAALTYRVVARDVSAGKAVDALATPQPGMARAS